MNVRLAVSSLVLFAACAVPSVTATPGANGFDVDESDWLIESTAGTGPHATWQRHADAGAISAPNVVGVTSPNHSSEGRFNLYWTAAPKFGDGCISVAVRGDSGVIDQGGGPMWRVVDAKNYYVCRFNPLESNYRVYVVVDGVRKQLGTALAPTSPGEWHRIEVEHTGDHIVCYLDGVAMLDVRDKTLPYPGGVGLWTKADACTSFDDLSWTGR